MDLLLFAVEPCYPPYYFSPDTGLWRLLEPGLSVFTIILRVGMSHTLLGVLEGFGLELYSIRSNRFV